MNAVAANIAAAARDCAPGTVKALTSQAIAGLRAAAHAAIEHHQREIHHQACGDHRNQLDNLYRPWRAPENVADLEILQQLARHGRRDAHHRRHAQHRQHAARSRNAQRQH